MDAGFRLSCCTASAAGGRNREKLLNAITEHEVVDDDHLDIVRNATAHPLRDSAFLGLNAWRGTWEGWGCRGLHGVSYADKLAETANSRQPHFLLFQQTFFDGAFCGGRRSRAELPFSET
jgi:hypothetical protein